MLTDEVAQALADGAPVVALESTIISHGMPYPQNVEMATEVERIIRAGGAVPATIAVLDGRPRIGLDADDLELLATHTDVAKVSVRDLPYVISRGSHGATTVAATMRLAALAGISVFVTGGLGGVHRGAQQTFDISADLTELSLTDVTVVSAGVKSILDIGLTLETLETLHVPVLAYGTDEFPAFFSRRQRPRVPDARGHPRRGRRLMAAKWGLGLAGGVSLVNPIREEDEIPAERDGRRHRAGHRRHGRRRHPRQGGHALPARPDRRDHRRGEPHRQHRAGEQQRASRCRRSRRRTPPWPEVLGCRSAADALGLPPEAAKGPTDTAHQASVGVGVGDGVEESHHDRSAREHSLRSGLRGLGFRNGRIRLRRGIHRIHARIAGGRGLGIGCAAPSVYSS